MDQRQPSSSPDHDTKPAAQAPRPCPPLSAHPAGDIAVRHCRPRSRRADIRPRLGHRRGPPDQLAYPDRPGRDADERSKLEAVNDFINNAVAFGDDLDIWGEEEYWATPLQTLTRGRGDCEDFAIGKYFTLVRMGVPSDKLRLTFVKALSRNQAHMVLTYYPTPNAQPLVLDNLERDIRPAAERGDLLPVYAFNHHGIFLAKSPQQKSRQSPRMLSRWSELNERIVADGAGLPGTPAPAWTAGRAEAHTGSAAQRGARCATSSCTLSWPRYSLTSSL
ncbi:transglutaminase-like cysteine peptidase [Pseudomonas lalucatii]|nr:transglutaminase-like cysteine peptidase [Pseudomonas lalucatii]